MPDMLHFAKEKNASHCRYLWVFLPPNTWFKELFSKALMLKMVNFL